MTRHSCIEQPPSVTQKMRSVSVIFRDGMIVTDDDLTAAMMYPVALMTATNRAVFGCGVACGFDFAVDSEIGDRTVPCAPGKDGKTRKAYPVFQLQIMPGTAIDCAGFPLELCAPVAVDVAPEKCGCDERGGVVCIAIRRGKSDEAPRGDCCGSGADGVQPCSRKRDLVEIGVFPHDRLPEHTCMLASAGEEPDHAGNGTTYSSSDKSKKPHDPCACLTACGQQCCGEGWVLLGCVEVCKEGIVEGSLDKARAQRRRRWIKTVQCHCPQEQDAGPELTDTQSLGRDTANREVFDEIMKLRFNKNYAMSLAFAATRLEDTVSIIEANKELFNGIRPPASPDEAIRQIKERIANRPQGA